MRADKSPWVALEYCTDLEGVDGVWACESPESCQCTWRSTYDLLKLPRIGCKEMGSLARVGVYAPATLLPYAKLPSSAGGSTGYFKYSTSDGTIVANPTTAVDGCKFYYKMMAHNTNRSICDQQTRLTPSVRSHIPRHRLVR